VEQQKKKEAADRKNELHISREYSDEDRASAMAKLTEAAALYDRSARESTHTYGNGARTHAPSMDESPP
jgi:hypothetical protein